MANQCLLYRSADCNGIYMKGSDAGLRAGDTLLGVYPDSDALKKLGFPFGCTRQQEREAWLRQHQFSRRNDVLQIYTDRDGTRHPIMPTHISPAWKPHPATPPAAAFADPSAERDAKALAERAKKPSTATKKGDAPRPFCPLEQVAPMPNAWGMGKVWGAF